MEFVMSLQQYVANIVTAQLAEARVAKYAAEATRLYHGPITLPVKRKRYSPPPEGSKPFAAVVGKIALLRRMSYADAREIVVAGRLKGDEVEIAKLTAKLASYEEVSQPQIAVRTAALSAAMPSARDRAVRAREIVLKARAEGRNVSYTETLANLKGN
jgi:hypothetical protein